VRSIDDKYKAERFCESSSVGGFGLETVGAHLLDVGKDVELAVGVFVLAKLTEFRERGEGKAADGQTIKEREHVAAHLV
jgi:hypothetical protein